LGEPQKIINIDVPVARRALEACSVEVSVV